MKQTKFFAILLCVCLLMTVLVACEKELTAEEMVAKAALSALEQPYALTTTVNYSCDDPNMKEVFAQMSGMEMTIYMDGTNFAMDMAVYGQSVNYVFVDQTMYLNMGDMKVCCELTAEEAQEALGTSASGVTDLAGFANVTMEKDEDGNTKITCKGLSGESNELVDSMMGSFEETDGMEVSLDTENLTVVMVIDKDCNYRSVKVDMSIRMDIEGYGEVVVDASMDMKYDFAEGKEITAPADADSYEKMSAEDLLG